MGKVCHVALKCRLEERQRQHSSNLAIKGSMNLLDKRLDDGITDRIVTLDGILAGSLGAGQNGRNVSIRVWECHFNVSVNLLLLSSPTTMGANPILTDAKASCIRCNPLANGVNANEPPPNLLKELVGEDSVKNTQHSSVTMVITKQQ